MSLQNWWPPEVEAQFQQYHNMGLDAWLFQNKSDGIFFSVGGIDNLGVNTILMTATLCKFLSHRMEGVNFKSGRGFYRG